MTVAPEKFIAARKASGMTLSAASELANVTVQTYIAREKHPEQFRICELEGVYEGLNKTGKSLLREGMCEIFFTLGIAFNAIPDRETRPKGRSIGLAAGAWAPVAAGNVNTDRDGWRRFSPLVCHDSPFDTRSTLPRTPAPRQPAR